jgi:hypothetical protein
MTGHVELRPGSLADLPALEPLWVSVHHQHVASMPELAPYVDDGQTWAQIVEIESLGVLPGNTAAIRLYQRYGFRPTWSCLSRFSGR